MWGSECLAEERIAAILPVPVSSSSPANEMAKRDKKFEWILEARLVGILLLSIFSALLVFMERDFFFMVGKGKNAPKMLSPSS